MAKAGMKASLRSFLEGLIDYAGLFPPAGLPMDAALATWRRHRAGDESLALARFLCPVSRLDELAAALGPDEEADPLPLTLLAGGGKTATAFGKAVAEAAATARAFAAADGRVRCEAWELKLPPVEDASACLAAARAALPEAPLFFEADSADWAVRWPGLIEAVATLDRAHGAPAGFKVRCGGLKAADFPETERLAVALHGARRASVTLKFTAGLHHPVRHKAKKPDVLMHGFFNVFGAGILAHSFDLRQRDLLPILEERNPRQFRFDDWGFVWRELRAGVGDIRQARRALVTGFGSCSVDEPFEDLAALRLLPTNPKERIR